MWLPKTRSLKKIKLFADSIKWSYFVKQSNRRRVKIDKRKRSSFSQKPLSRRFGWCLHVRTSSRVLYKATARVAYPSAALFRVIFFSSHWPGWLPWTASRAMCIVTIKTLLYPLLGDNHGHSKRPKLKGIVNFTHAKQLRIMRQTYFNGLSFRGYSLL